MMDTAAAPPPAMDDFVELLHQQGRLYAQLRRLCARQRTLIELNHTENLLQILRERQAIMNELRRVQDQLAPLRAGWNSLCEALSEPERDAVSALLERARLDVQAVLESDQQDTALLSARKQSVATELRELGGTRNAGAAYAQISSRKSANSADLTG